MEERNHKVKIDQAKLKDFFMNDNVDESHLKEIRKVFNVVMIKHYSKYVRWTDDLYHYAILAIYERKKRYDPSFSAYNYIYTTFRNELGNKIRTLTREYLVEDLLSFEESVSTSGEMAELPASITRYKDHLLGMKQFTFERLPKSAALELILFTRLNTKHRVREVPQYITDAKNPVEVLYTLLKETYQFFEDEQQE